MKKIKEMTNKELFNEYRAYDQMINDVGCFGVKDMLYFLYLQEEINKRGLRIKHTLTLEEE